MEIRKVRELTVGRGPENDLDLADLNLSRRHCRFFLEGNSLFVEDLDSMNGTRVNGLPIIRHRLAEGDLVQVGPYHFRIKGRYIMAGYRRRISLVGDLSAA